MPIESALRRVSSSFNSCMIVLLHCCHVETMACVKGSDHSFALE